MSETILRTIHLGLGEAGLTLLRAVVESPLVEPTALVDLCEEGLETARELGGLDDGELFEYLSDALPAADADAVVIAVPLRDRVDAVMEALANDLHVLVLAPITAEVEDAQRCVFISQNRGVRLMVADLRRDEPEAVLRQFHTWIFGGEEPETSARRYLSGSGVRAE